MPTATPVAVETHGPPVMAQLNVLIVCLLAIAIFLVLANLLSRAGKRRR